MSPRRSVAATVWPWAPVSSALAEMLEDLRDVRFQIADFRFWTERADAGEGEAGKALFPCGFQRGGLAGREGEKEFVIFAVGDGLGHGAAGGARQGGFFEGESAATGGGEAGKVGGESVAEVHHGVEGKVRGEPAGLGEARGEVEMPSRERAAEPAGDVKRVAGASTGAEDAAGALDGAGEGDVEEKRAG